MTRETPSPAKGALHMGRNNTSPDERSNHFISSLCELRQEVTRLISHELRHVSDAVQSLERLVIDCRSAQRRLEAEVGRRISAYEAKVDTAMASCRAVVDERISCIETDLQQRSSATNFMGSSHLDGSLLAESTLEKLEKSLSEAHSLD